MSANTSVKEEIDASQEVGVGNGASEAKWFVDGQDYMSAVADAIVAARKDIFITDWQMNPHIHMKRPADTGVINLDWRLDKMLQKKARDDNVKVYILLYNDVSIKMDLGNKHVHSILKYDKDNNNEIIDNIEVHCHPKHDISAIFHEIVHRSLLIWSHHEKVVVIDRSLAFVGGIDLCFGRWDTHAHNLTDNYVTHPRALERNEEGTAKRYSQWVGMDYDNTVHADGGARKNFDKPLNDCVSRNKVPRLPWHDVACSFNGDAALVVAKHFIQRYKFTTDRDLPEVHRYHHPILDPHARNIKIDVLRSSSSSVKPHETSIHQAYLDAITSAEHFIYIENQFFSSSLPNDGVENKVQLTLCNRIVKAHKNGEDFHVIIILPLRTESEGEWGKNAKDLEALTYYNYATLYHHGDNPLMQELENGILNTLVARKKRVHVQQLKELVGPEKLKELVDPEKIKELVDPEKLKELVDHYISVYSLRTHDILKNDILEDGKPVTVTKPVTEMIYVHSKVMIVDDRKAIIGSANINDRSMMGCMDSEVDVIVQDKESEMIGGRMNGNPYQVGKFSHSLRCHLLKEHLGLLNEDTNLSVEDPLTDEFHDRLSTQASTNTEIYEEVFKGSILPVDSVLCYKDIETWKKSAPKSVAHTSPQKGIKMLSKICGNIVKFPSHFLEEERQLKPSYLHRITGACKLQWDFSKEPRPPFFGITDLKVCKKGEIEFDNSDSSA